MTTYIGLTAQKGVGKSTMAAMLQELLPDAEIIAFADALRDDVEDMLCVTFGGDLTREWLEERKGTVFGPLLQGYGEFCRQWYGPDYWIRQFEASSCCADTVIIPDVRYVNEAEWIKAQGGLLVAIIGPSRWEGDQRDADHPSEAYVRECQEMADLTIHNGFSLNFLRNRAQDIANHVSLRAVVA